MSTQAAWRMDLIVRGMNLRRRGLSYPAIAVVLAEYHDFPVTSTSVRHMLRRYGAAPAKPRGSADNLRRGRVAA